jgi:hypothetical protein
VTNSYFLLIAQFVGLNTEVYLYLLHIFNYNKQGRGMYGCHNNENLKYLTFSVRHLNAIKSTAGRSFLGIKPLPALQQM